MKILNTVIAIASLSSAVLTGTAIYKLDRTMRPQAKAIDITVAETSYIEQTYYGGEPESYAETEQTVEYTYSSAPIYAYIENNFVKDYDVDIQEEIWRQWNEFEGDLPPYEMVLALWISESNLDPRAVNHNTNGTTDYGIAQLNTVTVQECSRKGWYDWQIDDIDDYRTQIRLGLLVLNEFCEKAPGGEWEYYRAIRAYQLGVGGLEYRESIGDFGGNDTWYEGPDSIWYPGKYGKIKQIQKYLVPVA